LPQNYKKNCIYQNFLLLLHRKTLKTLELNLFTMTLSTDFIYLTDEIEGFKECRDTRFETSTTVLLCKKGFIEVSYRGEMIHIGANDIFIRIPNATEKGPFRFSEDFQFQQLSFPAKLFAELMYDLMRVEPHWWAKHEFIKDNPIFHLTDKSVEFCDAYHRLVALQLQDKPSAYRLQILKTTARAASMELLNYLDKVVSFDEADSRYTVNSSDYTFHEFMRLLRENPHKREVQWFAEKLNITPKYLSEISKERSGKSASEWIAHFTVAELKHLLRNTTLPIRDVAKMMEFPNASFFCQYTKKHTGLTPNHFRKQKEE